MSRSIDRSYQTGQSEGADMSDGVGTPARHARARARKHRSGAVMRTFDELLDMPNLQDRRRELLRRLDDIYESALGRCYVNKHGDELPNPDNATALRCIEVADAMVVEVDGKQQRRANLLELSMFKTERKAG